MISLRSSGRGVQSRNSELAASKLLIPICKRKIEPIMEITPKRVFMFVIWVNSSPEASTIGASVSKGMQATFTPARLP